MRPLTLRKVYLWMHYSQGRDRWFGRIQSAPTVDVVLSLTAMGKFSAPTVNENITPVSPQS
ncbi:hypothetical protein [Phocaeicola sp.]